jgi:predicted dehydrogenase
MLKIGVLGSGDLAKIHIYILMELVEDFNLIGFYEPNDSVAQEIINLFKLKRFDTYDDLLQEVDCVDIVTSTLQHYEFATKALRNSKHVFIEKPITQSIDEIKVLINLSREANVKVQVGYTNRFNPAFIASIPSINKPKLIDVQNHLQYNSESNEISLVMDLMLSDIDIVLSIVKSGVRKIAASGVSIFSNQLDIINARLEFDNGCVANFNASRVSKNYRNEIQFFQQEKCVNVNFLTNEIEVIQLKTKEDNNLNSKIITLPEIEELNPIKNELKSFHFSILNDQDPVVSLGDDYNSLLIAFSILEKLNQINIALNDNN